MKEEEEKMELRHEPVSDYQTAFPFIVLAALIHLGFIFIRCFL